MSELLLEEQAWWDARKFDQPEGYVDLSKKDEKIRHIQLHVAKAGLKWLEAEREEEVAADLAIYRSQLINIYPVELEEILWTKPGGESRSVFMRIVTASGELARYIEPIEHSEISEPRVFHITEAIRNLHLGAVDISNKFGFDLTTIHRNRMESLLGESIPNPLV